MITKNTLIMDQHFRRVEELFNPITYSKLEQLCKIFGGINRPMSRNSFLAKLPEVDFVVAAKPELNRLELDCAPKLKAIIEVSGTFQTGLDYDTCFERGIEVLSCAPGFQYSVAEMALGLIIAGCRGIIDEHERFRSGSERWLSDNIDSDFSLFGQTIGFIGFGSIAQECKRLLDPFKPKFCAFDPWLKEAGATIDGVEFMQLEDLMEKSRCVVVAATPTEENYQLVSRKLINKLPRSALVVIISRSHLVDFEAMIDAANAGRIRLASDVFPHEPVSKNDTMRQAKNVIWSPHRAAAVKGGRQPIGDMILHDVKAILSGSQQRKLQPASPDKVGKVVRAPFAAKKDNSN